MNGKTVLITGSNKGIGFEIARKLGSLGFRIVISGRSTERLKETEDKLKGENILVSSLLMDVSNPQSVEEASKSFGKEKLEVLINNAAVVVKGDDTLLKSSDELLRLTIETNCYGPLRVTKAFLPCLTSPARVIMMSSEGGSLTDPVGGWSPAYCVSKTLLNSMTRQLAFELEDRNIAVNAVCPGWVKTDMGGAGAPRSIQRGAETPVWLATEAPQSITGKFFRDKEEIPW